MRSMVEADERGEFAPILRDVNYSPIAGIVFYNFEFPPVSKGILETV